MNIVNVGYDSTHYYVVEQQGRHLLVDTGWPGTLPKLQSVLRRKGIALQEIEYLFVTHFHPDHAGLVQELKQQGVRHLLLEEQRAAVPRPASRLCSACSQQRRRSHSSFGAEMLTIQGIPNLSVSAP
jgi:glyoxylase-like metal-dependent hydrolase (beta-lactamase superfamily II)